jgi:hypothetical protein
MYPAPYYWPLIIVQEFRRRGGFINGDPGHGGRQATDQELESLSGERPVGVPKGLVKCPACGRWRGECLGTAENYKKSVLPASKPFSKGVEIC